MGLPITKTVVLVWDGVDWRNQETGVLVTGIQPLYNTDDLAEKALDPAVPLQSNTADFVQQLIERELDKRTVFLLSRMYFNASPDDDKLVTIGHVNRMLMHEGKTTHDLHKQLETRIVSLHERLYKLERPWWKLW